MKILACVPLIPFPAADGLRVRIFNLYRELARNGHEVHFFCLSRMSPSPEQEAGLSGAGFGMTVALKPMRTHEQKVAAYTRLLVRGIPAEFMLSWEDVIFRELAALLSRQHFDVVIAEHLFMARYILGLDFPKVLQEHNIEAELMMSLARRQKLPGRWTKQLSAKLVGRYERKLLRQMQGVIAVTRQDADAISRLVPGASVRVVENGVSSADYAETAAAHGEPGGGLMFVGLLSYPANIEAVEWFVGKVLRSVREKYQDTTLTVIGSDPVQRVLDLDDGVSVKVTGFVDDVRPYYRQSSIQVVPLLVGGGSRLKILESFAAGTPVVSTSKGAEGLEVEDGRHLLIADTPGEFAAAVIRLREDTRLYHRLREKALALAREKYDWPVLALKFEAALAEAAGKNEAGGMG